MRLIHFSDTHLGFAESAKVDPATGVNVRELDVYTAFQGLVSEALRRRPDVVVHAGDLFHSPRPSNRAIVTALFGLQQLSAAGIPVVLIAGNHSVPRASATGSIFEALRVLPGIRTAHAGRYEVFEIGELAVHCVPHVHGEEALQAALAEVKVRPEARFNVLVLHGAVRGASTGDSLGEFNEVALGREVLARFGDFDYVALGHYHAHLRVAPNACYSGAPERFHQNEAGARKGFLEVDLAAQRVTFNALPTRPITLLPPVQCRGRALAAIVAEVEQELRTAGTTPGAIVVVRLAAIDPATWIELQRERRRLERAHAPDAFEVRWDRTFAAARRGRSQPATIGSLATEFAAFMKTRQLEGSGRERLRQLGERLIADAQDAEADG